MLKLHLHQQQSWAACTTNKGADIVSARLPHAVHYNYQLLLDADCVCYTFYYLLLILLITGVTQIPLLCVIVGCVNMWFFSPVLIFGLHGV